MITTSKKDGLWFIASIVIIAVTAVLLPGARLTFLLPAAAVSELLIYAVFCHRPYYGKTGWLILLAGYTLIVCGIIWNIHYYTLESGGTFAFPVLQNNDAHSDWTNAVNWLYGDVEIDTRFGERYYKYLIIALLWLFGRDIGVPLMFNALMFSSVVMLIGSITWTMIRKSQTSVVAMGVTSLICYLMTQSTVLIKDVILAAAMSTVVLVLVRLFVKSKLNALDIVGIVLAMTSVTFLRPNIMPMIMIGIAILFFPIKREKNYFRRCCYLLGILVVCIGLFVYMKYNFETPSARMAIMRTQSTSFIFYDPNVMAWNEMLPDEYDDMSYWQKFVWLPASALVQFLVPFPWNFSRDMIFGPTMCVAHFGYFWYFTGAILAFWLVVYSRRSPQPMLQLVIWGILLTLITAYLTSGRISRYCLPYLPMFIPAVAYTLSNYYKDKRLWIWLAIFSVVLGITLVVCHNLQMAYGS